MKQSSWQVICALILMVSIIILGGKAENNSALKGTDSKQETQEYAFAEINEKEDRTQRYCEDHNKSMDIETQLVAGKFLKSKDFEVDNNLDFEISYRNKFSNVKITFYNPIIYKSGEKFEALCIDEDGVLYSIFIEDSVFEDSDDNIIKHCVVHHTAEASEKIVFSDMYSAISYEKNTGTVKKWCYGKLIGETKVPKDSSYVGYNNFESHMFKSGTDVWAVEYYGDDAKTEEMNLHAKIIAHNVKFFITPRYMSEDLEYHALFLMTDGTLKTYRMNKSDFTDPTDENLIDVKTEGGEQIKRFIEENN